MMSEFTPPKKEEKIIYSHKITNTNLLRRYNDPRREGITKIFILYSDYDMSEHKTLNIGYTLRDLVGVYNKQENKQSDSFDVITREQSIFTVMNMRNTPIHSKRIKYGEDL